MVIYPDIEIQNGRCVNLHRGHMEDPIVYHVLPVEAAQQYVSQGAQVLHVVDLDNVMRGGHDNHKTVLEIIQAVDVPVQVGGGIRTIEGARWWFEHGASRVVIGTAAIEDRHFLHELCNHYPGQVVVSIDARQNKVMCHGWTEETIYTPLEMAKDLQNHGVAAIIYTDIDLDEDHPEATFATTTQMVSELNIPVISSGTVKTLDDISTLRLLPNIAGVVVGRALMNGAVALADALEVCHQADTHAEFV
ncbi:MAG: 1-(5-phosphoribosyl)-5-[(5-phosphoribosylamino)methylideneamino] imidazole-4-carboxamide isomerase [Oceanospirillaceae bacterium]|jgi:phosphoribosylformimino-5-aminoimidazole carboxamide ribotide isomerase|nr:1-(5-phosphoribosyl)-5-[(5-phosphoribosylamino)methylideneamino] imidazole-4-carboxamide isomerase [Oceanospirillaceae bacterium]MBT4443798.1 1-(5-phosphoribosyl)-5-[(5-phosphoribosylamino)methylideneamino] imidazole-4-carboxamide isomerase [Oceanospirillaceae bacterium]MBT6078156.1 1-(5-phosphoribosyl)-5-[(5-phosphoribosylamino)methylideneamino] imidazole-4-carboxamide isomerase [Oceanospirillaceae bacterium]MBT7331212.1 1-(5-phosphoribosyl)-5-[(5-phosphoribosylamino)methylideneamino] imidaz